MAKNTNGKLLCLPILLADNAIFLCPCPKLVVFNNALGWPNIITHWVLFELPQQILF